MATFWRLNVDAEDIAANLAPFADDTASAFARIGHPELYGADIAATVFPKLKPEDA